MTDIPQRTMTEGSIRCVRDVIAELDAAREPGVPPAEYAYWCGRLAVAARWCAGELESLLAAWPAERGR